jgi:hypothetical protein
MPHVYKHHPWTRQRKQSGPVRVADQLPEGSPVQRFNTRLALKITAAVGSMFCAYVFTLIALISLPAAITSHSVIIIVSWVAQTFLQLVLLAVILVGQNVQARAADKQSLATFNDGEAALAEILAAQAHLLAQDELIKGTQTAILAAIAAVQSGESGEQLRRPRVNPKGK